MDIEKTDNLYFYLFAAHYYWTSPLTCLALCSQAGYSGWDMMQIGGAGLTIPLNHATYALCWETAYLGVRVDTDDQVDEINEANNVGLYEVILDCGSK